MNAQPARNTLKQKWSSLQGVFAHEAVRESRLVSRTG